MAIVFAVRSDDTNFDARYAGGFKRGTVGGTGVSSAVDATAIGGRSISYTSSATWNGLHWSAERNTPNSRIISVLIRYAPNYSGIPAGRRAIWGFGNGGGTTAPLLYQLYHEAGTGQIVLHSINEAGTTVINFVNMYAWTTAVAGTWYDIVVTWDGTSSANAAKLYLDTTLVGQTTPTQALSASMTNTWRKSFSIGLSPTATASAAKVNEIVFWDTVIDPTANQNLESGSGLLNGASRTSYVSDAAGQTLTSFDGLNSTDPGVANVLTSAGTYYINGVSKTPTYVSVGAATNVKTGVSYGVGLTGSYDGSERYTDPDLSKIDSAYSFKYNTTGANNRTGTATIPSLANTKTGVAGYGGTGTYDGSDRWTDPGESNVSTGVQYKANSTSNNKTGTLNSVTISLQRMSGNANRLRLKGVIR